jgi:hypothetical protein
MSWMISVASTRSSHEARGECTKVYAWPSAFLSVGEISSHRLFSLITSRLSVASSSSGYRISGGFPLMKRERDGVTRGRNDRDCHQYNDDKSIFFAHPSVTAHVRPITQKTLHVLTPLCRFFELGTERCSWRNHRVAFNSATRDSRPVRDEPSSGGFFIARGNQMLWPALRSWWDSSVEANSTVLPCWAVGKSSCLPPLIRPPFLPHNAMAPGPFAGDPLSRHRTLSQLT